MVQGFASLFGVFEVGVQAMQVQGREIWREVPGRLAFVRLEDAVHCGSELLKLSSSLKGMCGVWSLLLGLGLSGFDWGKGVS